MPDEMPEFSSTPLEEKPKRKRTYHRRVAAPAGMSSAEKKEITKNLTSIYSDNGKIPDMRRIKVRKSGSLFKSLFIVVIIGGLLAAAAWSGFFVLPNKNQTSESKVEVKIAGPETLSLGAENTYNISYENKENVRLTNVILSVKYPETFSLADSSVASANAGHTEWNLGTILPRQKGNITITGKNYGALNQEGSWRIFLNYKPENFNSELQKVATLSTKISQTPFSMAVSGPDKIAVGSDAKYTFTLVNNGEWWPEKLEMTPVWPENFYPASSTPALEKNKWIIKGSNFSTSTPIGALNFVVIGKWGDGGEATTMPVKTSLSLPFNGEQYVIAEANLNTELVKNTVGLNLAINGSMKEIFSQPGDSLNITVGLKNTSQGELNKASVKLILTAPSVKKQSVIDWGNIVDKYDANVEGKQISDTLRQGQIIWTNTQIKDLTKLKPGQEVNIDVQLPIKDTAKFDWTSVKDYKITASAEVSYTDSTGAKQIVSSNPINITLNSDFKFESRDSVSADEMTHEINWVLTNNFHPVKNIKLTADVFGDITFTSPEEVPAGEFKFDSTTKKITWTIPEMPESVDVLAVPFSITINKKNPTQNTLISKVHIQAEDAITGQNLDIMGDEVLLKQ